MAEYYDTDADETRKVWSKRMWYEYRKANVFFDEDYGFFGDDPTMSPFVKIDELQKGPGDRVRDPYVQQLTGRGVVGDEVLETKEEAIATSTHDIVIDVQRHAVRTRGRMTGQRTTFDSFKEAKNMLRDWHDTRRGVCVMNQLCGFRAQTDSAYNGLNAIATPSNVLWWDPTGAGGNTSDADVAADTTAIFSVDMIDEMVLRARLYTPAIKPFKIGGREFYGIIIHSAAAKQLRDADSQWYATMQSALRGGEIENNPLFGRALGRWHDTLIFLDDHVPRAATTAATAVANTRVAVFFGAGALRIAYGRPVPGEKEHVRWTSNTWDYGAKYGAAAELCWGVKAAQVTHNGVAKDYGRIVGVHYVPTNGINDAEVGQEV